MAINYNNSKIYKIVSPTTAKIYIGSTTQILCKRIAKHLTDYRAYIIDNTKKYMTSYEILKLGDYSIKLIEECNFENREQLRQREGYYIKLHHDIVVNKHIAGRTKKEYRIDNKEHLNQYIKQYAIENKEHLNQYKKQYKIDHKEHIAEHSKQYHIDNKEYRLNQMKQYQHDNKVKLKQYDIDNAEHKRKWRINNKYLENELMRQRRQENKNKIWLNELTTL